MTSGKENVTLSNTEKLFLRRKKREKIGNVLEVVLMTFVAFAILYPLLFVLTTSFKNRGEFIKSPFSITFNHPENYLNAWKMGKLGNSILNTVIVAAVSVVCCTTWTGMAVFAIGVLKFKGSGILIGILMFTMFISGEMMTVPNILLIRWLNLYDSLGALIFPAALGVSGIGVFIGVNYMNAIPGELHEAAALDGATVPQMFYYVDLSLMKPILTYVAIGSFSGAWSDFFTPLVYIPMNEKAFTLALAVQKFDTQSNQLYGELCAALVILATPTVLVYGFFSKYFLEGVAIGAVKG